MVGSVRRRPRHPVKEFERLLRDAEERGWRIKRHKGYFRALCPEPCECSRSVALTPSGSRTLLNTRKKLERCVGWHKEDRGGRDAS